MQQFKIAMLLVVCGLYATSVAGGHTCTDDGYYVVENDCQKYYQCVGGRPYNFECLTGLKFDTTSFTCVWPKDANCVNSGVPQTTQKPSLTSPEPAPLTADCPEGDGFWVVKDDCTRFFGCSGGIKHFFNCPGGLKYSSESHTCVEPAEAKC